MNAGLLFLNAMSEDVLAFFLAFAISIVALYKCKFYEEKIRKEEMLSSLLKQPPSY